MVSHLEMKTIWTKFLPVPGLILTTVVTSLVLWSDRSNWSNAGWFYQLVTENRATVQIFVQIVSQLLGAIHVYTVCTLINLATRLRLVGKSTELDLLKFWNAVCGLRIDWSLPYRLLVPVGVFSIMGLLPSAIWAGALTPVITSTFLTSSGSPFYSPTPGLDVPQYSIASSEYRQNWTWVSPQPVVCNDKGIFTYSPNYYLQGLVLNAASTATNRTSSQNTTSNNLVKGQRKFDNSGYSYIGRSFGVGSSVGLVDYSVNRLDTLAYNYTEIGYRTQDLPKCVPSEWTRQRSIRTLRCLWPW